MSNHITVNESDTELNVTVDKTGIGSGLADSLRERVAALQEHDDE